MADQPRYPGTARWVKVSGIIGIGLVLLVVVLLLFDGGHGPGRHIPSGDAGGRDIASSITEEAATVLSVTGTNAITFKPNAVTVPVGEEITVQFTAEAAVEHDLVIEGATRHGTTGEAGHGAHVDDNPIRPSEDLHVAHADAGETVAATFVINDAGEYEVYCSIPGHREAGMVATLTAVDDDGGGHTPPEGSHS